MATNDFISGLFRVVGEEELGNQLLSVFFGDVPVPMVVGQTKVLLIVSNNYKNQDTFGKLSQFGQKLVSLLFDRNDELAAVNVQGNTVSFFKPQVEFLLAGSPARNPYETRSNEELQQLIAEALVVFIDVSVEITLPPEPDDPLQEERFHRALGLPTGNRHPSSAPPMWGSTPFAKVPVVAPAPGSDEENLDAADKASSSNPGLFDFLEEWRQVSSSDGEGSAVVPDSNANPDN